MRAAGRLAADETWQATATAGGHTMSRLRLACGLVAAAALLGAGDPAGATPPRIGGSFPCLSGLACSFGGYSQLFSGVPLPSDISTQISAPAGTAADRATRGYVAGILSINFTKKLSLTTGWVYDHVARDSNPTLFWRARSATVKEKLHYFTFFPVGDTLSVGFHWNGTRWIVNLDGAQFLVDPSIPGPSPSNVAQVFWGVETTSSASTLGRATITNLPDGVNRTESAVCADVPGAGTGAVWMPPPTCAGSAAATPRTILFTNDSALAVDSVPSDGSQPPTDLGLGPLTGGATYSPDGTRIAYGQGDNSFAHVFTAAADGSGQHAVTSYDPNNHPVVPIRWSPDARYLYFVQGERPLGIFRVKLGGAGRHIPVIKTLVWNYDISPDGTHVVFSGFVKGIGNGIFVSPIPAHGVALRIANGDSSTNLDWATPDEITYSPGLGSSELRQVRPDGTGDHLVFALPGSVVWAPRWSPDGSQIAYVASPSPAFFQPGQLFVANPDGLGAVQLTQTAGDYFAPSWHP
jgi:Tol biopolymer transport system component